MYCSQEEIEKKRLLALQRRKQALERNNSLSSKSTNSSTNTSHSLNEKKSINVPKPLIRATTKYGNFNSKFGSSPFKGRSSSFKGTEKFSKQNHCFNPIPTKSTQNFFGKNPSIIGKCYMITSERFTLETSSYLPQLVEVLKTIPSRSYDVKTKTWNFHLNDYETLMEKVIQSKFNIQMTGLPKAVIEIFRKSQSSCRAIENMDLSDIDSNLVESLMPFQQEGICYGISKGGRCMIADDMGLGKTIQALGIAHYFKTNWPLLIVAPASVRYHWAEAIYTFLPTVPAQHVLQFTSTKDFIDSSKIVITTYDLLVRAVRAFERRTFGFVILDESHALKSTKTARFKAAQCIVSQARHVVLLSGTPALSRPIELYSQINLIMPNFMGYRDYGIRYCAGEKNAFGWDFTGSSNTQELQLLLKHTCVIRRLKNEVLNQLPLKKREFVILDPDLIKSGTKKMNQISKKLERNTLSGLEQHNAILQYYNESSIAKQKAICVYVTKLFKDKQKCIIFAHHQNVLDAICEVAKSMSIKYIRIDGRTYPERRKFQVEQFQNRDDYLVAVLSITAANAGITLTAAQIVVFAELFWNPGILCQAEDRVHRIGQNENVVIRYLVAKHTADDYLWPLIQRKMNVLNRVGLDQDFCLQNIDTIKQARNTQEKNLDSFIIHEQHNFKTDENMIHRGETETETENEDAFSEHSSISQWNELKQEDFEFSDWDDME